MDDKASEDWVLKILAFYDFLLELGFSFFFFLYLSSFNKVRMHLTSHILYLQYEKYVVNSTDLRGQHNCILFYFNCLKQCSRDLIIIREQLVYQLWERIFLCLYY